MLKKIYENAINERLEDIGSEIIKDKEHKELMIKSLTLFQLIKDMLPEEHKHLLFSYEENGSAMACIEEKYLYKYAFKDGFQVSMHIKELSK